MTFAKLTFISMLLATSAAFAAPHAPTEYEKSFYTITTVELVEIKRDRLNQLVNEQLFEEVLAPQELHQVITPDPIDQGGRIISVARDLVALGEDVYNLVTKGKPSVVTKYDPLSVVPKVDGKPVDLMDTEEWKFPTKRSFALFYKNKLGMKVIDFKFDVMWSYGGKYNGKGAYITGAQIIPAASAKFGFDFTATMKVGGIQNAGKRDNPIAVASLLLEHSVSNILNARSMTHIFVIDGLGRFKRL